MSFALPLDEARAINLEGTRRMLEFAELRPRRGGLRRYAHVSTAYVAGTHPGRFAECDLDLGQAFHNSYEQLEVRGRAARRARSRAAVHDPAAEHRRRRPAQRLDVGLQRPLLAAAGLRPRAVHGRAGDPEAPVDVVSVDYVADAIHALCEARGGIGETYHLTAGPEASTIGEIAQLASRYFRRPLPQVLPPAEFAALASGGAERSALDAGRAYFPYFSIDTVFDQARTRARLEPRGIRASPLRDYLERLLDFATRSRWGKRPIARVDAALA